MSRAEAIDLLDDVRAGADVPAAIITEALIASGDIDEVTATEARACAAEAA
jgi:hypothetical protein